jgi:hypothetical protein
MDRLKSAILTIKYILEGTVSKMTSTNKKWQEVSPGFIAQKDTFMQLLEDAKSQTELLRSKVGPIVQPKDFNRFEIIISKGTASYKDFDARLAEVRKARGKVGTAKNEAKQLRDTLEVSLADARTVSAEVNNALEGTHDATTLALAAKAVIEFEKEFKAAEENLAEATQVREDFEELCKNIADEITAQKEELGRINKLFYDYLDGQKADRKTAKAELTEAQTIFKVTQDAKTAEIKTADDNIAAVLAVLSRLGDSAEESEEPATGDDSKCTHGNDPATCEECKAAATEEDTSCPHGKDPKTCPMCNAE